MMAGIMIDLLKKFVAFGFLRITFPIKSDIHRTLISVMAGSAIPVY